MITCLAAFAASAASAANEKHDLAGTWRVVETFPQEGNATSAGLITFHGTGDAGTLLSSFDASFLPDHPCLPEQGSWKRAKGNKFVGLDEGFCYSLDNGSINSFFDKILATYNLTLSPDGNSFTGTGRLVIPNYLDLIYMITGVRQPSTP